MNTMYVRSVIHQGSNMLYSALHKACDTFPENNFKQRKPHA
jgi:hypothetical protein